MQTQILRNTPSDVFITCRKIVELAHDPQDTRGVRAFALAITEHCETQYDRAKAIYDYCFQNIAYVNDPTNRELVQRPLWLLHRAVEGSHLSAGDCDDFTAVQLALCSALGLRCYVVLNEDPDFMGPENDPYWAHIYLEVETERGIIPCDAALKWLPFGRSVDGRLLRLDVAAFDETEPARLLAGFGPAQFVQGAFNMASNLVGSFVGADAQKKAAKYQAQAQADSARAQGAYMTALAEMDFEAAQLELARLDAKQSELAALEAISDNATQNMLIYGGLAGATAIGIWLWNRH